MDQPLSGDRLTEERAYMKRFSEGLAGHPVQYPADYSTPLEDRPRKVPAVQVSQILDQEPFLCADHAGCCLGAT